MTKIALFTLYLMGYDNILPQNIMPNKKEKIGDYI